MILWTSGRSDSRLTVKWLSAQTEQPKQWHGFFCLLGMKKTRNVHLATLNALVPVPHGWENGPCNGEFLPVLFLGSNWQIAVPVDKMCCCIVQGVVTQLCLWGEPGGELSSLCQHFIQKLFFQREVKCVDCFLAPWLATMPFCYSIQQSTFLGSSQWTSSKSVFFLLPFSCFATTLLLFCLLLGFMIFLWLSPSSF